MEKESGKSKEIRNIPVKPDEQRAKSAKLLPGNNWNYGVRQQFAMELRGQATICNTFHLSLKLLDPKTNFFGPGFRGQGGKATQLLADIGS